MPVPDVQWLHRDKGKCLWTFSFCSNARSFDRPTAAKPGEKIKVPIFIGRKGAEVFCPALAFGGFVDGLCHGFEVVLFRPTLIADALALFQLRLNIHQFPDAVRLMFNLKASVTDDEDLPGIV